MQNYQDIMEEKDQRKDGESFFYLRPAASGCINAGCAAVDDALGVGLGLLTTIIFMFFCILICTK